MPDLFPDADGTGLLPLPPAPGWYLWVVWDLNYLDVGAVQVLADKDSHLDYLRGRLAEAGPGGVAFHLYQAPDGRWLTMYHQAQDHLPPRDAAGRPLVDGYRATDFWRLINSPAPDHGVSSDGDRNAE